MILVNFKIGENLWKISNIITIGIISTKDFNFLHYKTRFKNILSCMMSIETIIKHSKSESAKMTEGIISSSSSSTISITRALCNS